LGGTYEKRRKPSILANAPDRFKTTIFIEYNRDLKNELEGKGYKVDTKADSDVLPRTDNATTNDAAHSLPVAFLVALYLLPWIVSVTNKHPAKVGIFILNLLLGWTVIGWIIALIWAVTKPQPQQQVIVSQNMPSVCPPSPVRTINSAPTLD
jgi:hypothetical protein